jgi:hypothetical protein
MNVTPLTSPNIIATDVIVVILAAHFTQKDLELFLTVMNGFAKMWNPEHKEAYCEFYAIGQHAIVTRCNTNFCKQIQGALNARHVSYFEPELF